MTGYTVHTGSTEKFAAGWDNIFRPGTASGSRAKTKPAKAGAAKKAKPPKRKKSRSK